MTRVSTTVAAALLVLAVGPARAEITEAQLDQAAKSMQPQLITWRRDFHQHPELGNSETRTAKIVAEHLKSLGLDVRTGVAHTGVVGVLKGGKPGPGGRIARRHGCAAGRPRWWTCRSSPP